MQLYPKAATLVSMKKRGLLRQKADGMCRVVVVDDEPEFREWLLSLLKGSDDFEVVGEASTGTEAIQLVTIVMPALVIADVYIPPPDGLEVARYVHDRFPGIKAILISAHTERAYERLARREGALAFIPKARLSLDALRQALQGAG